MKSFGALMMLGACYTADGIFFVELAFRTNFMRPRKLFPFLSLNHEDFREDKVE